MSKELDFFIKFYAEVNLFGIKFHITTTHVCLAFVLCIIFVFAIFANRAIKKADPTKAPGAFLNVVELIVEKIDGLLVTNMGPKYGPIYANYVGTLFIFIIISNISGVLGLRPPTADFGVTLPLALITWLIIEYQGIKTQKLGKLKSFFEPFFLFLPMNIIGEFSTPLSMSLRLFGNILSGTVIMALIYGLLPQFILIAWPGLLHAYLDVFAGCLQAYVFCMLTMLFVKDAIQDE